MTVGIRSSTQPARRPCSPCSGYNSSDSLLRARCRSRGVARHRLVVVASARRGDGVPGEHLEDTAQLLVDQG